MRSSSLDVPGLPTRDELQQWFAEHEKIEKETEIFDSGELRKLKKFTKGTLQSERVSTSRETLMEFA